ncbi:hypothetical protein D3OALGA1CA_158 [Olavius algarvensis associated proteobacterium Delta 3]|nr:hypothetical protein D3OALGA1CA_158 [Olavius algarvensis associated proteobacterium Delta 3]
MLIMEAAAPCPLFHHEFHEGKEKIIINKGDCNEFLLYVAIGYMAKIQRVTWAF